MHQSHLNPKPTINYQIDLAIHRSFITSASYYNQVYYTILVPKEQMQMQKYIVHWY